MLFKVAVALLLVWLLGVSGLYDIGQLVHAFLLAGLMLCMLAFLKARERVVQRALDDRPADDGSLHKNRSRPT